MAPSIIDPELVIHLFASMTSPRAAEAHTELQRVWLRCQSELAMDAEIANFSCSLPSTVRDTATVPEGVIAAQQRRDGYLQGVARRWGDVLMVSIIMSDADDRHVAGWDRLSRRWDEVVDVRPKALLGSVTIFQAGILDSEDRLAHADAQLARAAAALLPTSGAGRAATMFDAYAETSLGSLVGRGGPRPAGEDFSWCDRPIRAIPGFGFWERTAPPTQSRQLMLLAPANDRLQLTAWSWWDGDPTSTPPLARYLMHAAYTRDILRPHLGSLALGPRRERLERARKGMLDALQVDDEEHLFPTDRTVVERVEDGLTRIGKPSLPASRSMSPPEARRQVFLVSGAFPEAAQRMRGFLRRLGLRPLELEDCVRETRKPTPSPLEVSLAGVRMARAALVLLTSNQRYQSSAHEEGSGLHPDAEVTFQAGVAIALRPQQTVFVVAGRVTLPRHLTGLEIITLDDTALCKNMIAQRLRLAGCDVNTSAADWLEPGQFDLKA
ncbi:CATRA conflict system CASPASE/TPR repeat-associated protein [Micromonospora sp. WMMA1947]|uniref:CATRA conflict system CASPASE/TPR repeat-associated protein n=1 Tax=Micromonospora sp. WMMA1947 TaxID=3015163 RepID=UPI00248BC8CF|nr:CATRA conflict system CASPASE/TPR repeat-associated protein [Micromonospora sp. WMMA1947]WBC08881.1 BN6_48550 family protein [Micromonospora sp. WMMA1947]